MKRCSPGLLNSDTARRRGLLWPAVNLILFFVAAAWITQVDAATPAPQDRRAAERSLLQGRIDESIGMLQRLVAANHQDGQSYLLLCRAFYAEEHAEEAIAACEHALGTLQQSSEAQDWMGRAYGMKAQNAGPLEGFRLARKVRSAFEAAVKLDPRNGAAVNDLSEYYVAAPAIVGGGLDKAGALAARSLAQLPQQSHRTRALAAEEAKDFGTAEREFQAAVDVAKRPDAWADLGAFYARRQQNERAVDALKHCLLADRARDAAVVDAASILDKMHLEGRLAQLTLQQYLVSSARSDAAPVPRVYVMLGKMMATSGDQAAARIQYSKALELAAGYAPARQALAHP